MKDIHDRIKEKFPAYVEVKLYYDGIGHITDYESKVLLGFDSIEDLRNHLNA